MSEESESTKVPNWLMIIVVGGFAGWLTWMSVQIVDLKVDMGTVKASLNIKGSLASDK